MDDQKSILARNACVRRTLARKLLQTQESLRLPVLAVWERRSREEGDLEVLRGVRVVRENYIRLARKQGWL